MKRRVSKSLSFVIENMSEVRTELSPMPPDRTRAKSSFLGDVSKLVGGTAFAQVLSVLAGPILTRLFAPDAFGTAAVFFSITEMITVVACLRYELAIMLPEHDKDAANVLAVGLAATLAIAGLTGVLILIADEEILQLVNAPELGPYLWLVPLTVLISGFFLALGYWNSRVTRFWRLSASRVSQSVASNGLQLAVGVIGPAEAGGLIGARILGTAVGTAVLGGRIWRSGRSLFGGDLSPRRMYEMARRFKKFPLIEMWGAVLNSAAVYLPVLLLSAFFTKSIVGYFDLSNRLLNLPMHLVGLAVAQVFFQRVSTVRSESDELAGVVKGVYRTLVSIGLFPIILLTLMGQDLTVVFFGQEWAEAGAYVQILSPWLFFRLLFVPMSTLFAALERLEAALIVHALLFLSRVLPLVVGGLMGDARSALALYSVAGVLAYGGLTLWLLTLAGVSKRHAVGIMLRTVLVYLPLIAVLAASKLLFDLSGLAAVALSLAAFGAYLALMSVTDPTLHQFVLKSYSNLRSRFARHQRRT